MHKCLTCRKTSDELDTFWDRVRLWCFNRFHTDIIDLSQDKYTQGIGDGYKLGFDKCKEIETIRLGVFQEEIKELQDKLHTHRILTINSLQPTDKQSILTQEKNAAGSTTKLLLGKQEIPVNELSSLKSEAESLARMNLWKVFQETLKEQAYQIMFEKSESFEDMKTGKMMLYNLGVQKSIVELLQSIEIKP